MISKFNQYINEGIRSKMTPKSNDDIKKSLSKLSPLEKIRKIFNNNAQDLYSKDEIDELLKQLPPHKVLDVAIYYLHDLEMVKKIINNRDLSETNNEFLKDFVGSWHYNDVILELFDDGVLSKSPDVIKNWFIVHCLENTEEEQEKLIEFYKEVLKLFLSDDKILKKLSAIEILGYRALLGLN